MELTSYKKQNCADGKECKKFGCGFFHPYGRKVGKDCRNGAECRGHQQGWCYFHHPSPSPFLAFKKKATIMGDDEYLSQNKLYSKLYQEYRKLFVDWRKRKNGKPTAMPRKCNIDYTALRQKEIDMGC